MIFAALAGIAFGICIASTLYVSLDERAERRAMPSTHIGTPDEID